MQHIPKYLHDIIKKIGRQSAEIEAIINTTNNIILHDAGLSRCNICDNVPAIIFTKVKCSNNKCSMSRTPHTVGEWNALQKYGIDA